MRQCKDQCIDKHPSMASECIKFVSHNQPYEAVESMDKRLKEVEVKLSDHVFKFSSNFKKLNCTTPKIEDVKVKASSLENRVGKLKKQKYSPIWAAVEESRGSQDQVEN